MKKIFKVEQGSETWDYDMPDGMPPLRHIDEWLVVVTEPTIKRFGCKEKAEEFAEKMNNHISKLEQNEQLFCRCNTKHTKEEINYNECVLCWRPIKQIK